MRRKSLPLLVLALVFSSGGVGEFGRFGLAVHASGKLPAAGVSQAIALPSAITIDNFGQVNPRYYRGAQPKGRDFADLSQLGVKLVIDLAAEGDVNEAANAERAGMKFVRFPLATTVRPPQSVIADFLALVNEPSNQPVYVHCMGGRHRTGVMTAVYRMTQDGWTADRAFSEMKQYKFGADFLHPALKTFVFDFYSQLAGTQPAPKRAAIDRVAN
jgi:protein tyrosine/serine phosphatase